MIPVWLPALTGIVFYGLYSLELLGFLGFIEFLGFPSSLSRHAMPLHALAGVIGAF